ncbi:MAG: PspC domain-containing protein [Paludibacteraceae bacterium]|nr:PspC domain-containing protein [Paludibacteraceae bacterium]
MEQKKLTRSNNKSLAGVCAGIAEYFDVDPTVIRILYVFLTVFSAGFPGILVYIILALIMPVAPNNSESGDLEKKD